MLLRFFFLFPFLAIAQPMAPHMTTASDESEVWWVEGNPKVVAKARPWRILKSERFALVLDTSSLEIPHFGALKPNTDWRDLPPAKLSLSLKLGDAEYRCTGVKTPTRLSGPRLVEAGRFFQRTDVTGLVFEGADGRLDTDVRLETSCWGDRLNLVLQAEPNWRARNVWRNARLDLVLERDGRVLRGSGIGGRVSLSLDPVSFKELEPKTAVQVQAPGRRVRYDAALGLHHVDLDGLRGSGEGNDVMERVPLRLSNPSDREHAVNLLFARNDFTHRLGFPITGVSAVLRDASGEPVGIPVQLSKNWHKKREAGRYAGQWLHGFTRVRLPAKTNLALELCLVYGHWGGVAAASHAQLSLVGWGGNDLWHEAAIGSWGESICFDPELAQAGSSITDVRPLMVRSRKDRQWDWTHNVGGGNFFTFPEPHSAMRSRILRHGPCLTEAVYEGRAGSAVRHREIVSISRGDDMVRATYRIRMDIEKAISAPGMAVLQVGSERYNQTREKAFKVGNMAGPLEGRPLGEVTWASMYKAERKPREQRQGAWANRGIVVRAWTARIGGKPSTSWQFKERPAAHGNRFPLMELLPASTEFVPGDFIETTVEHLVLPQKADDYYGPNEDLRNALRLHGDSWKMVHREAIDNRRDVKVSKGALTHRFPDVRIACEEGASVFTVAGGLGYVPITFTGLTRHDGFVLTLNGVAVDQSVHGNDFWQTDYDPETKTWSRTYTVPIRHGAVNTFEFGRN